MKFLWNPGDAKAALMQLNGPVRQLWIASAYLSDKGLLMVEDLAGRLGLSAQQVTIFVSDAFSESELKRIEMIREDKTSERGAPVVTTWLEVVR